MRLPEDIDRDDVNQWLRGCWFYMDDVLVKYEDLGEDYNEVMGWDYAGDRSITRERGAVRIEWPQVGAVNVPERGAVLVEREADRQWRRAFTTRNLQVWIPRAWDLRRSGLSRIRRDDYDLVRSLFNPEYPGIVEATEMLNTVPTVALNRQIMLVRVGKETLVYYGREQVGRLEAGGFKSACKPRVARRVRKLMGGINA